MKWLKYGLVTIAALFVLLVLVAVYFVNTFDPNQYKDTLVSIVQKQTGRNLVIQDDIGFTFFPRLGLEVGSLSLSDDPNFDSEYFAKLKKARINVDLLSILKRKIVADRIVLEGLSLRLIKNKKGVANWESMAPDKSAGGDAVKETGESKGMSDLGFDIAGVSVIDANVYYQDDQAGTTMQVSPFNLETGEIADNKPIPVSMQMSVIDQTSKAKTDVDLDTVLTVDFARSLIGLDDLAVAVNAANPSLPGGSLAASLAGAMKVDVNKESVQLSPLQLKAAGMQVDGKLGVNGFETPAIAFALNTDEVNLDKLMPASEQAPSESTSEATTEDDRINLPIETLRTLNLDGSIAIGKLVASGITATNVSVKLLAKDGLLKVNPLTLDLYQGKLNGEASLDARRATPAYAAKSALTGIEISGLMAALAEDGKAVIRGKSDLQMDVTTGGDRVSTLKKKLNGSIQMNAVDGALVNEKLARNVERVVAFLKGREPAATGEELVFDSFTGSANIRNGVASNKDLSLKTPLIYGAGEGTVDIANSSTEYELKISLAEDSKRAIPIKIKGPFDDLSYSLDLKAALKDEQKKVIEEKKEELKEKLDEKINEKLGDGIGDKLKNLKLF